MIRNILRWFGYYKCDYGFASGRHWVEIDGNVIAQASGEACCLPDYFVEMIGYACLDHGKHWGTPEQPSDVCPMCNRITLKPPKQEAGEGEAMSDIETLREKTSYQLRAYFPWPTSIPSIVARRAADELDRMEEELAAKERDLAEAVAKERERCVKVAKEVCANWNRSAYVETVEALMEQIEAAVLKQEAGEGER